MLRRDVGSVAIADMLLLVLIADASQNAMAGGYESVGDGMVLVGTIAAWNWGFDFLAYRFPLRCTARASKRSSRSSSPPWRATARITVIREEGK